MPRPLNFYRPGDGSRAKPRGTTTPLGPLGKPPLGRGGRVSDGREIVDVYTKPDVLLPAAEINRIARLVLPTRSTSEQWVTAWNMPVVPAFGRVRISAIPVTAAEHLGNWYYLYCLGRGEWEDFEYFIINGRTFTPDSSQVVSLPGPNSGGGPFGQAKGYLGTSGQTADSDLSTAISGYSDTLAGVAYLVVRWSQYAHVGRPQVEVVAKTCNQILDYRDSTTKYSTNPWLILAHWLTNPDYGEGRTLSSEFEASIEAAADTADEDPGDGSKRRELGFQVPLNPVPKRDVRNYILAHCNGWLVPRGTDLIAVPNRPATSGRTIYDSDCENIQITKKGQRKQPKQVEVRFIDPLTGARQKVRYPASGDNTGVTHVDLYGIPNGDQAYREAKERYAHQVTEDLDFTLDLFDNGIQDEAGDVITLKSDVLGVEKEIRVSRNAVRRQGRYRVEGTEYNPGSFADDTGIVIPPVNDSDFPDPFDVPDVTGLTVSSELVTLNDGVQVVFTSIAWTAPANWDYVGGYKVEVYNTDESPDRLEHATTAEALADGTDFIGLLAATNYRAEVTVIGSRAPNLFGDAVTATHLTVSDTTAPGTISGAPVLTTNGPANTVTVTFNALTDSDLFAYRVDCEINTGGGWSADQIIEGQGNTITFVVPALFWSIGGSDLYRVRVQGKDRSGNLGTLSAYSNEVELRLDDLPNQSVIAGANSVTEALNVLAPCILKAYGNVSATSFANVENAIDWQSANLNLGSASTDLSLSGSEITINTAGAYRFTVSLRTTNNNRTELLLKTYRDTGSGFSELVGDIMSDYVSRDTDQNTGGCNVITILDLDVDDVIEFRGEGDCDGTCTGMNNGTILLVERLN